MKFKILLGLFLMLVSSNLMAQEVEVYTGPRPGGLAGEKKNFELFGKGLLDYGFEGQLQATAQAIKINIGEPNKFSLPISLLVGATNSDIGSPALNKSTVMSLISPTGGTTNVSTNFYLKLFGSGTGITSLKLSGLVAGKLITGRDSATNKSTSKPSGYFDGGLYFQTGAWTDEDGYKDGGIFWAQAKYTASYMAEEDLKTYFGPSVQGIPHGPRVEIGCFIQNRVNIKLSYYKAIGGKEIPTLNDSQFRLALDYSVFAN
jgi:hypothetical protein